MIESNCPCVPLGARCLFEEHAKNLLGCSCRIIGYRLQELKRSLPIIGDWFAPYKCDFFIEQMESKDDKQ